MNRAVLHSFQKQNTIICSSQKNMIAVFSDYPSSGRAKRTWLRGCLLVVENNSKSLMSVSIYHATLFADDIVQFLSGNDRSHAHSQSLSTSSEVLELSSRMPVQDDDDDSLLQLNSSSPNSQSPSPSSSDSDLAMYDDPNSTFNQQLAPLVRHRASPPRPGDSNQRDQRNSACTCSGGLQGVLYKWLGVPIQKYPLVVVGCFVVILVSSIALDAQIRASTKPPAFFKESTNLQQLLSLRYNMSSDNLNVNDLAWDLVGNDIKQSNNADNPTTTTQPTTKPKETNGATSSKPTPQQPGRRPKTNIQQHSVATKSTTTTTKPTTRAKKTPSPTPTTQKLSSSR